MKENIKLSSRSVLLLHVCTLARGIFIYIFEQLEFTIRQIHIHELNKNHMKLMLASCHMSTNSRDKI